MDLIEELTWRGMIQDIVPGTREQLLKEQTTGYIGFDPTADSLHIGSLLPVILLVHLQRAGHRPIALVGGATGMVGDPSGKSAERNLLDEDTLSHNLRCIRSQIERFLDFDPSRANGALVVNNYDWFREMSFLQFIRDTGKLITINYMLAKESVKKRMESENGLSFTEFTYQLVQGYDFYHLFTQYHCKLQMGGSDQWGNIVTGTELIRRRTGGEAFAFTCPLLTRSDGGKFGKTEQGNIWLDPAKTSPYHFYQFWLNAADDDAEKWIRIFSFLDRGQIEALILSHRENPADRVLQKALARETTTLVHGKEEMLRAMTTTESLFTFGGPVEWNEAKLENLEGVTRTSLPRSFLQAEKDMVSLLAEAGIFSSKGEARKMILNGGISLNQQKISDPSMRVTEQLLLHSRYLLVQKGRKNHYLILFTS
ncbi:MAG TPA: tyrosine--tRNA ligase [Chitinophagaceae bacterium]|nr:tyrosine--tRNA ligase [Chitinophagaceae bacterium]